MFSPAEGHTTTLLSLHYKFMESKSMSLNCIESWRDEEFMRSVYSSKLQESQVKAFTALLSSAMMQD